MKYQLGKMKGRWGFAAGMIGVTAARLVLSRALMVWFLPGTIYDDILQIGKAFSISGGEWLGEYGSLTLVKGAGFPLLSALFSGLGIPFVPGFHLLYVGACIAFVLAARPMIRRRWVGAAVYIFMLFNPIAFSAAITRLYRDICYYALALYVVAFALGFLLRYNKKRGGAGYALCCGFALALAANTREDSHWLFVYVAACLLVYLALRLAHNKKKLAMLLWVPAAIAVGWGSFVLPVGAANYANYGVFVTDEYNTGAYARAYDAVTRLNGATQNPHYAIRKEQREQLYALSPAFAELEWALESEDSPCVQWLTVHGEYLTGYFSFTLRQAAEISGKFETAETAAAYFNRLAGEVNALCDSGAVDAGPPRSGIAARFYSWMLPDILSATFEGAWHTLRCGGVDAAPIPADADHDYLLIYEGYIHDAIAGNRVMKNGAVRRNYEYTGLRRALLKTANGITALYSYILPVLFALAVGVLIWAPARARRKGKAGAKFWARWLCVLSLLCAFLLRCAMIAYVHVSSFSAIYNPAYQAASYPMALGFIALAFALAVGLLPGNSGKRIPDAVESNS